MDKGKSLRFGQSSEGVAGGMEMWVTGSTLMLLAIGCWTDLRSMRIPNKLTAGFAAGGLIFHAVWAGWHGLFVAIVGGLAGLLPFLVLYRFGGIGAGDIKWFGAYGTWTGASAAMRLMVDAVLIAGVLSFMLLSLRLPGLRRLASRVPWPWGRHPSLPGRGAVFPFMLAVTPGYAWLILNSGNLI